MKLLLKILKYFVSVIVSVVLVLYIFSVIFEKKISVIFIGELNKKLKTELVAGDVGFSLLKRFPRASIELGNTLVKSPAPAPGYAVNEYPDTLLFAGEAILTLRILELVKKNYIIDRIDIKNGKINISKSASGKYNTDILIRSDVADSSAMSLNINNVNISNSSFTYKDNKSGFYFASHISNSSNKLSIQKSTSGLRTRSGIVVSELKAGKGYHLTGLHTIKFNSALSISRDSILIDDSEVVIDGIDFTGSCKIMTGVNMITLRLSTDNAPAGTVARLLPGEVGKIAEEYNVKGTLSSSLVLEGKTDRSSPLLLNASVNTGNSAISMPSSGISLEDISASSELKIEFRQGKSITEIIADNIYASLDGYGITGSLVFKKDVTPYVDFIIRGLLPSGKITEIIKIDGINSRGGEVRLNARLWGSLVQDKEGKTGNLRELSRSINLGLNSVSLKLPYFEEEIDNIHGNVMVSGNIWIDDLSMNYNEQNIILDGMIGGFNDWLLNKDPWLFITAGIWSDKIDLQSLRQNFSGREEGREPGHTKINLNLNLACDSIISGKFRASLFDGSLTYVPGIISIPSFNMNTTGGSVSGNAAVAVMEDEGYALRGWFDIDNIDIKNAFEVFNNFRQEYIRSENLEGNLTGNISVSANANREFKIDMNGLAVSGDYTIVNGKLIDFEPAYKLSNFIEIDELESIEFSKLENELIINNRSITIPRMDISSSAFNISLEGNHSFNGVYEYHLKVLLSELLSKRKNPKISEFGVIEDDGLGRTSIYLRLAGDKDGSRVYHDSEALRAGIREDLLREKQTIRSILREEYGLFKSDSIPEINPEETRKFRIIWEETDSIRTGVDTTSEKKLPLIRLFRKKSKRGPA